MHAYLRISGVILLLVGLAFSYKPNLLYNTPLPADAYQLIELRVKWGFLVGLGLFFIFSQDWTSWKVALCSLLFLLTLGIIIVRVFGFVFDGFFQKQLLWLGIEIVALLLFGLLYRYAKH